MMKNHIELRQLHEYASFATQDGNHLFCNQPHKPRRQLCQVGFDAVGTEPKCRNSGGNGLLQGVAPSPAGGD
jgi:hypothetical protein